MPPVTGAPSRSPLHHLRLIHSPPSAPDPLLQRPQLILQFDNRGTKVADPKKAAQILAAVADCICDVPPTQVKYSGTIGQSSLFNHQSVSSYQCVGPTKAGKPVSAGRRGRLQGFASRRWRSAVQARHRQLLDGRPSHHAAPPPPPRRF
jgi:hypothetical protein